MHEIHTLTLPKLLQSLGPLKQKYIGIKLKVEYGHEYNEPLYM
jgi:hypothetical protein